MKPSGIVAGILISVTLAGCLGDWGDTPSAFWNRDGCVRLACPAQLLPRMPPSALAVHTEALAVFDAPIQYLVGNTRWIVWAGAEAPDQGVWALDRQSGRMQHLALSTLHRVESMTIDGDVVVMSVYLPSIQFGMTTVGSGESVSVSATSTKQNWTLQTWDLRTGKVEGIVIPWPGAFHMIDYDGQRFLLRHALNKPLQPAEGGATERVVLFEPETGRIETLKVPPLWVERPNDWSSNDIYLEAGRVLYERHRVVDGARVTEIRAWNPESDADERVLQRNASIAYFLALGDGILATDWTNLTHYGQTDVPLKASANPLYGLAWDTTAQRVFWSAWASDGAEEHDVAAWDGKKQYHLGRATTWHGLWWSDDVLVIPEVTPLGDRSVLVIRAVTWNEIATSGDVSRRAVAENETAR